MIDQNLFMKIMTWTFLFIALINTTYLIYEFNNFNVFTRLNNMAFAFLYWVTFIYFYSMIPKQKVKLNTDEELAEVFKELDK